MRTVVTISRTPPKLLHEQFGTELGRVDHFRDKAKRELRKIMCNCPTIKLSFVHGGVQIHADSLLDVSPKETREALEPPPNAMSVNVDVPSEKAITQVLEMKPAEGAIALTMKFREAVRQGKAENTDELIFPLQNSTLLVIKYIGAKVAQPIIPKPVKSPISTNREFFLFLRNKNKRFALILTVAFYQGCKKERVGRINEEPFIS